MEEEETLTSWSVERVSEWVTGLGLSEDIAAGFTREGIDGKALEMLSAEDLKELGVRRLGDRLHILQGIRDLSAMAAQRMVIPFNYDESVPFTDDREYLEAVRSHFLLKKMRVEAATSLIKTTGGDISVGFAQRKIAYLDEVIASSKRVIENKLKLAEQTPNKLLPRVIRSAQLMKMSENETWALALILVRNVCIDDFIPTGTQSRYDINSPSSWMHLLYTVKGEKHK